MPLVSVAQIEALTAAALRAHGAGEVQAAAVAAAVAHSEAHGNVICGLYYLASYCHQLDAGRVDGRAEPERRMPRPGTVVVDARDGFAQPAFDLGLPAALEACASHGTALLSVVNAHTCTSLGYFTERLARGGVLALGATNATAIVAPPGGARRVLGTNPIAFSVPDGVGGLALHFDFSTSAVALGKITMAKAAGAPIPEGWAVDARGRPTTDPAAALEGALLSAGGYKGYGLGLLVEVLASVLPATTASRDVVPLKATEGPPHRPGQTYLLVAADAVKPGFAERLQGLADAIDADPGARLPGAARAPMQEVPVPDALWDEVSQLAR
ncbi:MAG: Ldh family oxidoreductase [Shimia sp.]